MLEFPNVPEHDRRVARVVFVVAFYGLLAMGPLAWLLCEPASGEAHPRPTWGAEAVLDGRYARELEAHLENTSPIKPWLRSRFLEAELATGTYESSLVEFRAGTWCFLSCNLDDPTERAVDAAPVRQGFLELVRERQERDDLSIVVMIAPDKARTYSEFAYDEGRLPESRATSYRAALREFRDAGLEVVDVDARFRLERQTGDGELLFHRRDSHWTYHGCALAMRGAVRRIKAVGRDLGPLLPLTATLRMRTSSALINLEGIGFDSSSRITDWMVDDIHSMSPALEGDRASFEVSRPEDRVFLCGDSFAQTPERIVPLVLSRGVDSRGVRAGKGPVQGLVETLQRLQQAGLRGVTILWVFVERSLYERNWWEAYGRDDLLGK